ncbi:MAG: hypothetical protein ABSE58_00080 [Candidatus Limnocylindrales bacterium]|jgi:hypothetical protein
MTGWVAQPQVQPIAASSRLVVAGMGRRLGAWIIDATVVRLGLELGLGLAPAAGEYVQPLPPQPGTSA